MARKPHNVFVRILVIALLLCPLWSSVCPVAAQPAPAAVSNRSGVLPDSTGSISEITLHYDPELRDELMPVYRDLFRYLPADVRIVVVCPTIQAVHDFSLTWRIQLRNHDVSVINVGMPISVWARDRFIPRQSAGLANQARGFVPVDDPLYDIEKYNDLITYELLGQIGITPLILDSPLHIEGGNVVSNSHNVFIGANVLCENENFSASELTTELERFSGRNYLLIGDSAGDVPWFHIDMYLTPINEKTVLLASPRMGDMIRSYYEANADSESLWSEDSYYSDELQQSFDDVAGILKENGYTVQRMPTLLNSVNETMVTYNNVIMDYRNNAKTVYMPVYGIPELDSIAGEIYRKLGYTVHTVDVSRIYEHGGAIRCLVNVTRRDRPALAANSQKHRGLRIMNLADSRRFDLLLERSDQNLARRGSRSRQCCTIREQ